MEIPPNSTRKYDLEIESYIMGSFSFSIEFLHPETLLLEAIEAFSVAFTQQEEIERILLKAQVRSQVTRTISIRNPLSREIVVHLICSHDRVSNSLKEIR